MRNSAAARAARQAPAALGLAAALLVAGPAAAQLRTVVVPDGPGVVIGPRNTPLRSSTMAPVYRPVTRRTRALPTTPPREAPSLSPGLALLPLVAAAVLGATLPGSGGGSPTSATVRTR